MDVLSTYVLYYTLYVEPDSREEYDSL